MNLRGTVCLLRRHPDESSATARANSGAMQPPPAPLQVDVPKAAQAARRQATASLRFSVDDRSVLAAESGISNGVIERLEEVGFHSLAQLRAAGADEVVDAVCRHLGSAAWRNRRKALDRVLARETATLSA